MPNDEEYAGEINLGMKLRKIMCICECVCVLEFTAFLIPESLSGWYSKGEWHI